MLKRKVETLIAQLVGIAVCGSVMWRVLVIAPGFYLYFFSVVTLGILIYVVVRMFHSITAMKCPKCGAMMSENGRHCVFGGAFALDGTYLPPLRYAIHWCKRCDNEHHTFIEPHEIRQKNKISRKKYRNDLTKSKLATAASELGITLENMDRVMPRAEYDELLRKTKNDILNHNLKAGFMK